MLLRFIVATLVVWFAIAIAPENHSASRSSPAETLYPSHHCENGHTWLQVDSDADSVTVRCYSDPDPDSEQEEPSDAAVSRSQTQTESR